MTGLISLLSKGLSRFSDTQFKSINSLGLSVLYDPIAYSYMPTGKPIALTIWTFVGKVLSLPFNRLSRLVIVFFFFFVRNKCLIISWLQSLFAVILEPKTIKSFTDIYILLKIILLILEWSILMFLKSVTSWLLLVTVDTRKLYIFLLGN